MAAGTPKEIKPEYAKYTHEQIGYSLAGWFSFQPLWQEICRTDRAVRLTARRARLGRVEHTLPTAPPEALFLLSAISQYIGARDRGRCSTRSNRRPSPGSA